MTIEPIKRNPKAKIKFEGPSLIIEKAFQLDGVYHNIVLTDGNRALSTNNLKWAPQSKICQEITDLYLACVERAMKPEECGLQGPLEGVRFVYKKDPNGTEGSLTQMFWRQPQGHEARFTIGTSTINRAMDELSQKFSIIEVVKGGAVGSSKSKTSSSTASSPPPASSLIPDFLLGGSSDTPSVKVASPSGAPSSKPAKADLAQIEDDDQSAESAVRVAPPLPAEEERRVAKKHMSFLDQQKLLNKAQQVGRVAGAFERIIPGFKPLVQLWDAVRAKGSPTPDEVE